MPTLIKSGRVVIAESIKARPIHLAWGSGNGSWSTPPQVNVDATSLISEIARRTPDEVSFVTPDPLGVIVVSQGAFSRSVTPTRHLYVRTVFEATEAPTSAIREVGLFCGSVMVAGLPPSQEYFLPSQVASPGRLFHLDNFAPIFRFSNVRESFDIVVTF
jgi:hypothetical protein